MSDPTRSDDPGDEGIQPDLPRPAPRRAPKADDEPMLLDDEQVQEVPAAKRAVERATHLFDREFPIALGRPTLGLLFSLTAFLAMTVVTGSVCGPSVAGGIFVLAYLLLMALAVVVYLTRPSQRILRLTADGIELTRPNEQLAYEEILEVYTPDAETRAGRNFAIHLLHAHGYVTIPPSIAADSAELTDFLETQPLGERTVPKVPAVLRDFLKQQTTVHGARRVYAYRARLTQPPARGTTTTLWVAVTLALVGVGLGALGVVQGVEPLLACGAGLAVSMALVCLLVALQRHFTKPTIRNWQQALLVVGPDGLALVQGELEGELRWRELKSIKLGTGVAGSSTGAPRNMPVAGLHLHVAGATITIADIYHWPLTHVLERIERYRERR